MNSKTLVLVVFAAWSVLCWRWYVCGIMQACGDTPDTTEAVVSMTDEPDASPNVETPEIQPMDAPGSKPVSPANMDEVQMETVEDRMVIHFPYQSTRKEDNAAIDAYLAGLARQLIESGEKVSIHGHTDFVGENSINYNFGLRRAYGIRDILIKKGVPKSQIICKSFGERKPQSTNDTPYGRYLNRRAEIRVGN